MTSYVPRNLHSFPTRRSSDLHSDESRTLRGHSWKWLSLTGRASGNKSGKERVLHSEEELMNTQKKLVRSEEHTSELQSRFDLVCRLLLEKKKNILYFIIAISR